MKRPIFVLTDYPSSYYPVKAECKSLGYTNVFVSEYSAWSFLTARFGYIIIRDKRKK